MKMQSSLLPQLQQKLKLSPQIIQSIEILQLPLLALVEHIQQEMVDNPVLEEVLDEKKDENPKEGDDVVQVAEDNEKVDEIDKLGEIAEDWRDYYSQTTVRRNNVSEERDQKQEALENTAAKPMSLHDYLMGQLSLIDIPDHLVEVCENTIYSIDKSGYLASPLEEIMQSLEKPLSLEEVKDALKIIQTLEPPGVGARNLQECLMLQLDKRDPNYQLTKELLLNHLEDIEMKKYPLIAKKDRIQPGGDKETSGVYTYVEPQAWFSFCDETIPYVVPEVKVEYIDGKYEVFLIDNTNLPHLHISSFYRKFLNENGTDTSTRQYIQKKIESAKWLIDAIEQRRSTLYKVASKIVELQKDFLDEGIHRLRTLKMQDVADVVGVHVSTVSVPLRISIFRHRRAYSK